MDIINAAGFWWNAISHSHARAKLLVAVMLRSRDSLQS